MHSLTELLTCFALDTDALYVTNHIVMFLTNATHKKLNA